MKNLLTYYCLFLTTTLLAQSQEKLYLTDINGSQLLQCNLDGSELDTLNFDTDFFRPESIEIDRVNQKIYWTDLIDTEGVIRRANLDGSAIETVVFPDGEPRKLWLDTINQALYWSDDRMNAIRKSDLDLNNIETLPIDMEIDGALGIAIDLDNQLIYWSDYFLDEIWKANLDGSNPEEVYNERSGNIRLSEDRQTIFANDNLSGTIFKIDINGENREDLITGLDNVVGLELDYNNNTIYWAENFVDEGIFSDACVKRANLDDLIPEAVIPNIGENVVLGIEYAVVDSFIVSSSTELIEAATFSVYPNPFQDVIRIDQVVAPTQYTIHSLEGRLVHSGIVEQTIDLGGKNLPAGAYLLSIKIGEVWVKRKLMKL